MDKKKIIFIATGGSVALILITLTVVVAFRMYPEFFGYPEDMFSSKKPESDSLQVEKVINLSEKKLISIEQELKSKRELEAERDRLRQENKNIRDSLLQTINLSRTIGDSLKKDRNALNEFFSKYSRIKDSLQLSRSENKKTLQKIDQLNDEIATIMAKNSADNDTLKLKNFKTFAKMYNNSKPEEIANILEKIDPTDASAILKLMQAKKAGKVIEAMDPKIAAAILLLGVN